MKKAFIPFFMIFIGMFSHAEVTEITLQGQTIWIVYDAEREFNTQEFLSAIRAKEKELVRNSYINSSISYIIDWTVEYPSCTSRDKRCAKYIKWLDDHRETISQMFGRKVDLFNQREIILAKMQILKNEISYLSREDRKLRRQLEKRHDFLRYLETVVENQQKKKELTRAFERYNAEYARKTKGMNMNAWITNARKWAKMNNDSEVFEDFINNIEKIYKNLNQLNSQAFSKFHLLLTDYDPDILQNIFIFLSSFHNEDASQYQRLVRRLDNTRAQFRSLRQQAKAKTREMNSIWNSVASVKRRLKPRVNSTGSNWGGCGVDCIYAGRHRL